MEFDFTELKAIQRLQKKVEDNVTAHEYYKEVCQEHQKSVRLAERLQSEILGNIREGEDIYILFLKACQALSHVTGNLPFYIQAEKEITALYGDVFEMAAPIQHQIKSIEERLVKLKEAYDNTVDSSDYSEKKRILNAIEAHTRKLKQLQHLLSGQKQGFKERTNDDKG